MGGRFLHVVLMPEDGGEIRNFRISARMIRLGALTLGLLVLGLGTSLAFHVRTIRDVERSRTLASENEALRDRLTGLEKTAKELQEGISLLGQQEREARLLAGLDPIDEQTRRLGIGGPMLAVAVDSQIRSDDLRRDLGRQGERLESLQRQVHFQTQSMSEVLASLQDRREKLARIPTICPLRSGYSLSSGFGSRVDPFTGSRGNHNGLDLRAAPGTPVLATADGDVVFVGYNGDYGLSVQIDHGEGITTSYCHLSSACVKPGDPVRRGKSIGAVGTSGRSTGSHLHYEVWRDGRPVDPEKFILSLAVIVD
ncbi:MAG: M23 family metallopeptidase [Candidatus Eisenbacteria bacterium]